MRALPGGCGTLEELFEVIAWNQLGLHRKPCGLANVEGYYNPTVAMMERAVRDGFVQATVLEDLVVGQEVGGLLDALLGPRPTELAMLEKDGTSSDFDTV